MTSVRVLRPWKSFSGCKKPEIFTIITLIQIAPSSPVIPFSGAAAQHHSACSSSSFFFFAKEL
jgi:hypothetical protein